MTTVGSHVVEGQAMTPEEAAAFQAAKEVAREEAVARAYERAQKRRLDNLKKLHKAMGWWYRLLDVGYGAEVAELEARSLSTRTGLQIAALFDTLLMIAFFALWCRYDLISTWTFFAPVANGVLNQVPREGWNVFWATAFQLFLQILFSLLPTMMQFRFAGLATKHDGALFGLCVSALFDLFTDAQDVYRDLPLIIGGILDWSREADWTVWAAIILLLVVLRVIASAHKTFFYFVIGSILVGGVLGQMANVVLWSNTIIWTIFVSFAVQSLFVIQFAKVKVLIERLREVAPPPPPAAAVM